MWCGFRKLILHVYWLAEYRPLCVIVIVLLCERQVVNDDVLLFQKVTNNVGVCYFSELEFGPQYSSCECTLEWSVRIFAQISWKLYS